MYPTLKTKIKKATVDMSVKLDKPQLLESDWVTRSNSQFHLLSENIRKETGAVEPKTVYNEWLAWFKQSFR